MELCYLIWFCCNKQTKVILYFTNYLPSLRHCNQKHYPLLKSYMQSEPDCRAVTSDSDHSWQHQKLVLLLTSVSIQLMTSVSIPPRTPE
eukprot:4817059-Amphidinium_carterae.1